MSLTSPSAGNTVTEWDAKFFTQYVRENRFKRYMGTDENSIIVLKEDLTVKKGGTIIVSLIGKLSGAGVTGNGTLVGNEEALPNFDHAISVDTLRNAVAVTDHDEQMTEIDLRNAGRVQLKVWAKEKMRDGLIVQFGGIWVPTTGSKGVMLSYGAATSGQRNAWNVANSDRVLYGSQLGNYNATHSTALATIDNTADKLTKDVISLIKRRTKISSPIIRPVSTTEDEETYVAFCGSLPFRDLKADMTTVLKDAAERGRNNPLFRDGDLYWDGVVIREVPEIGVIAGVGAGGVDVGPVYFCGAQAIGVAWAKRTKSTTDVTDYGFKKGVGIHEMRGIEKLVFNGKDNGVFTAFVAAVGDA